jgi:hypothetical protein
MKKIILSMFVAATLVACGGGGAADDAQAICDCFIKANGLKADDPKRMVEQNNCAKLQMDTWNKYKDDGEAQAEFNTALMECNDKVMESATKN